MNTAELATAQFDTPVDYAQTRPLSAEARRENRSRKRPTYSVRVYNGNVRTIRVKPGEVLLQRFDEFAKRDNKTPDELIARSPRSATAFVD